MLKNQISVIYKQNLSKNLKIKLHINGDSLYREWVQVEAEAVYNFITLWQQINDIETLFFF